MQESGSRVFLARPALYSQSCVCALSAAELCFGLPDPASPAMVSHLGSSLLLPRHPGQMPRDGARMGGGSAGQQSGC